MRRTVHIQVQLVAPVCRDRRRYRSVCWRHNYQCGDCAGMATATFVARQAANQCPTSCGCWQCNRREIVGQSCTAPRD